MTSWCSRLAPTANDLSMDNEKPQKTLDCFKLLEGILVGLLIAMVVMAIAIYFQL